MIDLPPVIKTILPGMLEDDPVSRQTRQPTKRERAMMAQHAAKYLTDIIDRWHATTIDLLSRRTTKDDLPQVLLLNKITDKLLPDIRTEVDKGEGRVTTRVIIGAPIKRLIEAGVTVAAEVVQDGSGANDSD